MVTATEDFNYMGKHGFMIHPRVFCESPRTIFDSHRTKYREECFRMYFEGEGDENSYSVGSDNDFNITKNGGYLFRYTNRFNEGF